MKKGIILLVSLWLFAMLPVSAAAAEIPHTAARAFVLYCPQNQQVLLSANKDKYMKPASTTKLMTTLLTLEEAQTRDKSVTFTREMTAEGSSMYLKIGERVRLSDLAAGMMLRSGNDAANAAAISIDGSLARFASRMNRRARQIGMKHTHFVTPSGLDDESHYSTAYDLALLMAQGLRSKAFAALTRRQSVTVRFLSPSDKKVTYANHNKLLRLYPPCIGGKTGYTMAAGRCLVSAAQKNGVTLICVTLDDRSDWNDHMHLYDYGFSKLAAYQPRGAKLTLPVVGGTQDSVQASCAPSEPIALEPAQLRRVRRKIIAEHFVYAPVKKGQRLGSVQYILDGRVLRTGAVTSARAVSSETVESGIWQKIKEFFHYG